MPLTTTNVNRLPALKVEPAFGAERVGQNIRTRFNPIRNLTPETLTTQLDNFRSGHLRDFALTSEAIEERDDVLKSVIPKRKKSVARHGYEVFTVDDSPEAQRHKEALEFFYGNLSATNALEMNERGSFKLLVRQMLDAIGKKYAVHELIWQPRPDGLTAEFRFVPLWFFENRTGKLRFLRQEFDIDGIELEEGGWMVTVGEGLMPASAVAWMFKRLPLQDWLNYSEKFGMPGLIGKTGAAKDSDQWDNLVTALKNFATDWAAVMSTTDTIEALEVRGQANLPYEPLVDRMDRALARLWRGADLSTISRPDAVGANPQDEEGTLLEEDDADMVSETLNLCIDPLVLRYTFGEQATPLAYVRIVVPKKQNVDQDLKIDAFLRDSGAPLSIEDTLERYGRPLPEASEPILQPARPALPGFTAPFPNESPAEATARAAEVERKLQDVGRDQFARALATDLQPVRNRLQRILQITDPEILQARLRAFVAELPRLLRDINGDPESAKILEEVLSAALINGLATGTAQRP